jgi:hypothetical protein
MLDADLKIGNREAGSQLGFYSANHFVTIAQGSESRVSVQVLSRFSRFYGHLFLMAAWSRDGSVGFARKHLGLEPENLEIGVRRDAVGLDGLRNAHRSAAELQEHHGIGHVISPKRGEEPFPHAALARTIGDSSKNSVKNDG